MLVLGLNIGHDPSAALVTHNGTVLAAAHEARLTRFKRERRFPVKAIASVLRATARRATEIDVIVYSSYSPDSLPLIRDKYLCGVGKLTMSPRQLLRQQLAEIGFDCQEIIRVDHHFAHACTARLACSASDALIVTSDGYGDGISFTVRRSVAGRVPERAEATAPIDASLGLIYQYVTGGLGFSMLSEEWKVLGLEPFGEASNASQIFDQLIDGSQPIGKWAGSKLQPWCLQAGDWNSVSHDERRNTLRRYMELVVPKFERADVASAVQDFVERQLLSVLERFRTLGTTSLALAGGTFLNVKLNRVLSEIDWVSDVSVFPAAGDAGNAVGAALAYLHRTSAAPPSHSIRDVFWGEDYSGTVDRYCQKLGLIGARLGDTELISQVASAVAAGRIVAIARGRSEFGPRALLNRSLICRADRPDLTRLMTERLRRDPIMPYGCSMLSSEVLGAFADTAALEECMRFMIAAPLVTSDFGQRYSAVCHPIRGGGLSTRPHVVADDDSWHARLLHAVGARTGGAVVLNTSFNLHGEPIVETPSDALKSFSKAAFPNSLLVLEDRVLSLAVVERASQSLKDVSLGGRSSSPRRRREACVCMVFGASSGDVLGLKSTIRQLGLRVDAQRPIPVNQARQMSCKFAALVAKGEFTDHGPGEALLVVGSESASLIDRLAAEVASDHGYLTVTAGSELELSRQLQEIFPDYLGQGCGSFADLLLRPGSADLREVITALAETSPLALAGFIYSLDDLNRVDEIIVPDSNVAMVFGIMVEVASPAGGRMYLYAPEGAAALIRLYRSLSAQIVNGDYKGCRENGLILAYAPQAENDAGLRERVEKAVEWGIDGLIAVRPGLDLQTAEDLETLAHEHELAIVGGSACSIGDRPDRPYGVRSSVLGRFISRFPGLEI